MAPKPRPLSERFWEKVVRRPNGECWGWTGCKIGPYGQLWSGSKQDKNIAAHRVSWEIHNGPIPDGMDVLHRCDNPPCPNPDHLFLGTQADNNADKAAKGRARGAALGEDHHNSKLTPTVVSQIFAASGSQYEIARRFGVSRSCVADIKNGRTWTHLTSAIEKSGATAR